VEEEVIVEEDEKVQSENPPSQHDNEVGGDEPFPVNDGDDDDRFESLASFNTNAFTNANDYGK
jgi:hypothetical protein